MASRLPAVGISLILHAFFLGALYLVKVAAEQVDVALAIETVLSEDRLQEEVFQELEPQDEIAESLNFVAGSVSADVGGSNRARLSQQKTIEPEQVVRAPKINLNAGEINVPAMELLGHDLGPGEITGDVGAVVDGYGAALDRITQELIRLMRSHKLHVVWLFDESESMKDDQQELKKRLYRVYEELKLADRDPAIVGAAAARSRRSGKLDEILLTSIASFGEGFHLHTPRPTSDNAALMAAVDKVPVDRSGKENMCAALLATLRQFGLSSRSDRRLVLIVVSDESGDDGEGVEDVLHLAQAQKSPIYFLGRESVFGSLYAHVRWRHPDTGHLHYLPIRRGPETPYAEQLQWDGFRRRRDAQMSGFGPYEQVRLARDTGGIFFQLPNEERNVNDLDTRKYDMLDLREYMPSVESRRAYLAAREASAFRTAIWDVIVLLNPYDERNKALELPEYENFAVNPAESLGPVTRRLQQVRTLWGAVAAAQQRLDAVRGLRDQEPSLRWRANYDLLVAQLYAYRLRLYEYGIALHQFQKTIPQRIKDPKHNRWAIRTGARNLILPDPQQEQALGITAADVKEAHTQALANFRKVREEHPRTAWARRADWEEGRGFGATFHSWRYVAPNPPPKAPPQPTPPPKL